MLTTSLQLKPFRVLFVHSVDLIYISESSSTLHVGLTGIFTGKVFFLFFIINKARETMGAAIKKQTNMVVHSKN